MDTVHIEGDQVRYDLPDHRHDDDLGEELLPVIVAIILIAVLVAGAFGTKAEGQKQTGSLLIFAAPISGSMLCDAKDELYEYLLSNATTVPAGCERIEGSTFAVVTLLESPVLSGFRVQIARFDYTSVNSDKDATGYGIWGMPQWVGLPDEDPA